MKFNSASNLKVFKNVRYGFVVIRDQDSINKSHKNLEFYRKDALMNDLLRSKEDCLSNQTPYIRIKK